MANIKQHKTVARGIVFGGTILAGLGIWTLINQASLPASSNQDANITTNLPSTATALSENIANLTQPGLQTGPSVSRPPTLTQPTPAQPTLTPIAPSQPAPTQSTPSQPTLTKPAPAKPAPSPTPRLRTRGS